MVRVVVPLGVRRVLVHGRIGVGLDLVHTDGVTLLELGQQGGNGRPNVAMATSRPSPSEKGVCSGENKFVVSVNIYPRRWQITLLERNKGSVQKLREEMQELVAK